MKTRITLIILLFFSLFFGVYFSSPLLISLLQSRPGIVHFLTLHPEIIILSIIALLLQTAGHVVRAFKHRILLSEIRPINFYEVLKGQMIGFLFNVLLPFRLGEIIRAHYIGRGVWISRSAVFATIVFERLVDLLIISTVGVVSLSILNVSIPSFQYLAYSGLTVAVMIATLLIIVFRQPGWFLTAIHRFSGFFNERIKNRSRQMVWSFSYAIQHTINKQTIRPYIGMSIVMWLCYFSSVFLISVAFITTISSRSVPLILAAPYYGISSVSGPAYAGTFNSIFEALVKPLGFTYSSVYLSALVWLVLVVPSIVLGIIFIYKKQVIIAVEHNRVADVMKNKLYRDKDITAEFGNFLDNYFRGTHLERIINREEIAGRFKVIKNFKGGSNALTLLAWQNSEMVVKKITLPEYKDKLKSQYDWLKSYGEYNEVTNVVGEQDGESFYAIDIEFKEQFVPFFEFIHASELTKSWKILQNAYNFSNKFIYKPNVVNNPKEQLERYIADKVVNKVIDTANKSTDISQLMSYETIKINGEEFQNFNTVLQKIDNNKAAMRDLLDFHESPIHGDLTVDNIIVDAGSSNYLLLDPNNENAISDSIVDYAKLLQSLHSGYEFLVMMGDANVKDDSVTFEEKKSTQYEYLYQKLINQLEKDLSASRFKALLFHEAVHYCRMLTYRASIDPRNVAAFYAIAVRLLNEFVRQYEK